MGLAIRAAALGVGLLTCEARALAQQAPPRLEGPPVDPDRSDAPEATSSPPPVQPVPKSEMPDSGQRTARVLIGGPAGLRIEQRPDSNADEWELVCTAPCEASVPTAFYYRVSGGGVRTSAPFAIRASDGETEVLGVEGGSPWLFALGVTGVFAGGAAFLAGSYALFVAGVSAIAPAPGEGNGTVGAPPGFVAAGLLLTAGGALVGGGGWAVMNANRRSKVSQETVTTQARPVAGDAWRSGTWKREQGMAGASARAVAFPILSIAF